MTSKIHRKKCIGLHIALVISYLRMKIYWKTQYGLHMVLLLYIYVHRDQNMRRMPFRFRLEGPSLTQSSLRGPVLGYLGSNWWPYSVNGEAIEAFIFSQDQHKYSEKNVLSCIGRLSLHLGPCIRSKKSEASLS